MASIDYLIRLWNEGVALARQEYTRVREDEASPAAADDLADAPQSVTVDRPPRVKATGPVKVRLVCPYCDEAFMGAPLHRGPGSGASPHCGERACFLAHARHRQNQRRAHARAGTGRLA